jgi:catechol 2,3-dioxygenase-like lactoylglutathione lyase family enzyme
MWGKPPLFIADNCVVDVRNLQAVVEWYKEKLGLRESRDRETDDSGRRFADLCISGSDICISLLELEQDASAETRHVIFFTKKIEKAHEWLAERGVSVEPITMDSGGNRLFRFRDLEGNLIEVCVEPG